MERPALIRLLDDVRHGMVDIVVVYKVDRLTRSLADFAKLTELFEEHDASFVSVTQAFNTSTSMGRLTLNLLLSFAQFEREVAGERIRDKIALSKRRGMWMGGLPPLGYDGVDKKLVVSTKEAQTVQLIFRRYLEIGSIAGLKHSLDADGIVSKHRVFQSGRTSGGNPISRGALYQVLRNRLYRGEIAHRKEVHAGNHVAIIEDDLWSKVQALLTKQASRSRGISNYAKSSAPLTGLLFDADGNRMTPTHSVKTGRRYRYYTSAQLVRGGKGEKGIRVPADDLEDLIVKSISDHLTDPAWVTKIVGDADLAVLTKILASATRLSQSADSNDMATDGQARFENLIEHKASLPLPNVISSMSRMSVGPSAWRFSRRILQI